jgi:aminoglycoside/choline kinase family phosphotransferase
MSPISSPSTTPASAKDTASTPSPAGQIAWAELERKAAFEAWLAGVAPAHRLQIDTLRGASADASFRRYFRIDGEGASFIVMDAPPDKENSEPFVRIARLMAAAGLRVPDVLDWDEGHGFLLLSDLGAKTMMEVIDPARPEANQAMYLDAVDALIQWQLASKPGVLPPYDEALLRRELALFPDWYLAKHRGVVLEGASLATLNSAFDRIVEVNLAQPPVYVHRDFMPRNLMAPTLPAARGSLPPEGAAPPRGGPAAGLPMAGHPPGVLDFQDAVYGPITYDIASLMRDAFLSWEENFVLDITIRYWERARKAGLPVGDDFGEFYRGVEWMGLQRHFKVAGIFARLTLRDGKPKYLADTPRFIAYIRATTGRYNELRPLMRLIDEIEGTTPATGFAYGRM